MLCRLLLSQWSEMGWRPITEPITGKGNGEAGNTGNKIVTVSREESKNGICVGKHSLSLKLLALGKNLSFWK